MSDVADPITDSGVRFLLRAGRALSESLDYETTLERLAWQAVPELADWCAVDLLDRDGRLRRLAVAHSDPAKIDMARQIAEKYPEDPDSPTGSYARLRRGAMEWVADIPDELLTAAARDAEHLAAIRGLGLRSYISVPLLAEARPLGLLTLVYAESGRRYSEADARIVEELGRRASLAIEHAETHRALVESHARLQEQALELELQTQQMEDQAVEMETQQAELESANEELLAANEELRRSEEFTRGIVEAIAEPLVVYDANWRVTFENDAARGVFAAAARRESLVGLVLWDVFPDLEGTSLGKAMRQAASSRQATSFVEQRQSTGNWTEVRCYPLPAGGLAVAWTDITSRKRGEETLYYISRASEIFAESLDYETTLHSLARLVVPDLADWCSVNLLEPDGSLRALAIAHKDPDKVHWARELQRRYPPDPKATSGAAQVIRSGKPEFYPEITERMLEAAVSDPEYLEIVRKIGFTSAITVPLHARGRTLGALSLITAESRRHYTRQDLELALELGRRAGVAVDNARLYSEALEARRVAEEANAAKAAFLANMSHELRTPLNAIAGYADLLSIGVRGTLTPEQLSDVERIRRSQQHLLSMINEILNYARLEAGRVQYDVRNVNVRNALAELETLFAPQLRARELRLAIEEPPQDLDVRADADKLQQILLNLMSNAIKFANPGSAIEVSTRRTGRWIEVAVRDAGRGIPADALDAIFEPFVQIRIPGVTGEGVGLGLAISRDLARGMDGELTAASDGTGATFTLRLPAA